MGRQGNEEKIYSLSSISFCVVGCYQTNGSLQASKEDQHAVGDALRLSLIKDSLVLAPLDSQLAAVDSAGDVIGNLPLAIVGLVGGFLEEVGALDGSDLMVSVRTPHAIFDGALGVGTDDVEIGLVVERDAVAGGRDGAGEDGDGGDGNGETHFGLEAWWV